MWWNFVRRSHEEIVAFREQWRAQSERFDRVKGYVGSPQHLPAPPLPKRGSSRDSIRPVPVTRAPEADRPAVASAGELVAEPRLNRVGLEVSTVDVAARPVRV